MKYPIFLTCLCAASIASFSQSVAPLSTLSAVHIHPGHLDPPDTSNGLIFNHFEIVDQRPDTARIGIHTTTPALGRARDHQLIFDHPAAAEMASYLNKHFTKPNAPYTGLIVLRNLWLFDANYLRQEKIKDPDKIHERTHIRIRAEIYAATDKGYIPLLRFDTLFSYKRITYYAYKSEYDVWDEDLAYLFDQLADTASYVASLKTTHNPRLVSRKDIDQYNQSRFVAPILDNTPLSKGVYMNFEEFRNNTPSVTDFEVKKEGNNKLLYIKENGSSSYYTHNAWGYCDGKDIFIMRNGLLCPAWKEGKAYYFYTGLENPAIEDTVHNTGNVVNTGQTARCFFTIDMDTGDVY